MKINIYYGGRGILDDPTLYVVNKIQEVLTELNVRVELFKLYELKNTITTLPASINDCDGILLATTLEWFGIGGFMQQFLDACWLYGNREKFSATYMCPVVISTTYGEKEAMTGLQSAWELLGGVTAPGLSAYVSNVRAFETNQAYNGIIEKYAENIYRTISQKVPVLPASTQSMKKLSGAIPNMPLTPQETEQLSKYAADETYVQQQKEDIAELTSLFKGKLEKSQVDESTQYIADFQKHFQPGVVTSAVYRFDIKGREKPLILVISDGNLECSYGERSETDLRCKLESDIMDEIVAGRMTVQRAFMTGAIQAKGDIKLLRELDQIFDFENGRR
ncbi:MAG: SCP2 sterol-binding domain-containing protein [Lachnospiraceae bacterium]|nr:SCP2 sterol-binding domain-containing protein [Lachnospiraceae bacterium]